MLRDDIKTKVIQLLHKEFPWIEGLEENLECNEYDTFFDQGLGLSISDVRDFREVLLEEFEVEDIPLNVVMTWLRVKDAIDFLEDNLSVALDDMPYISGFEPEA